MQSRKNEAKGLVRVIFRLAETILKSRYMEVRPDIYSVSINKEVMDNFIASLLIMYFGFASIAIAGEKPRVLLFERNPWLMVIGSDSPTFAYYENGLTIYWDENEGKYGAYKTVRLNTKSGQKLVLSQLIPLLNIKEEYSLTNWTDQTIQNLYFNVNGVEKNITVYGDLRKNKDVRSKAPKKLLKVFDSLFYFKHNQSKNWTPKYIEVMVWPYGYAPDKSIVWPKSWPNIESKSTRKRGESYSIYLPYERKKEFKAFMSTRSEKAAVLMNGKKWAVSTRIPFPHEITLNN